MIKSDRPKATAETLFITYYDSPLGRYVIAGSERGVVCVEPEEQAAVRIARWKRAGIQVQEVDGRNDKVVEQLDAYFAGKLRQFDVPLDLRGTEFQRSVWKQLLGIPYSETRSYGQVAHALSCPKAGRAVGRANGSNPIAIIVACHRVIGTDGNLVGYAGGLDRKKFLLELEARVLQRDAGT